MPAHGHVQFVFVAIAALAVYTGSTTALKLVQVKFQSLLSAFMPIFAKFQFCDLLSSRLSMRTYCAVLLLHAIH